MTSKNFAQVSPTDKPAQRPTVRAYQMTSPIFQERYCWWCQTKLATSFALAKTPDGDVRVHKMCKDAVADEFRQLTAQIRDEQGKGR